MVPNRAPPAIVTIRTASGWMPSAAPIASGWTSCWRTLLAMSWTTIIPMAASGPAPPSAMRTVNAARRPRAEIRDVGGEEGDRGDRPEQGHAEDQAADGDDDGAERGDDRDPEEVAAERAEHALGDRLRDVGRHADVPAPPRRESKGPSLGRKKRLSAVIARKKTSEESSRGRRRGHGRRRGALVTAVLASCFAVLGLAGIDPEALQPARNRVLGVGKVGADVGASPVIPPTITSDHRRRRAG